MSYQLANGSYLSGNPPILYTCQSCFFVPPLLDSLRCCPESNLLLFPRRSTGLLLAGAFGSPTRKTYLPRDYRVGGSGFCEISDCYVAPPFPYARE